MYFMMSITCVRWPREDTRRWSGPLRMGVRHGHRIVANRQLLVANAFEDLLAERMPGAHRRLRNFYDRYGYPIARHIRSRWMADLVYFIMKPLEYFL